MSRYTWMIWSKALPGRDAEYNKWYDEQHIGDVMKIACVRSGRRYLIEDSQIAPNESGQMATCSKAAATPEYVAVYEIESSDVETEFLEEVLKRTGTDDMPLTPALDFGFVKSVLLRPVGVGRSKGAEVAALVEGSGD